MRGIYSGNLVFERIFKWKRNFIFKSNNRFEIDLGLKYGYFNLGFR